MFPWNIDERNNKWQIILTNIGLAWVLVACIILQTFLREPLSFPMHHFGKSIQHLLVYLNLFRFECWFLHLPVKYQSHCAGKAFGLFLLIYFQYFTANLRAIKELHPVMAFIWVFRFCSETSKWLPLSFNNSSNINGSSPFSVISTQS